MKFNGSKTQLLVASWIAFAAPLMPHHGVFPQAFANEGGEGHEGGGHEEGGHEGGEGGAAKPKVSTEEFRAVTARVQTASSKMKESEEKIHQLIHEKKEASDPQKQKEISRQMIDIYKEMQTTYKDYQKDLNKMRYEYPEKGDMTPRRYTRFRLKSLDEMERGPGLEADLDYAKGQLHRTYGEDPNLKKKSKSAEGSMKAKPDGEVDEEMERPVLKK